MQNFPDWILRELNRRGWTPAELAKRAGVNTGTLSRVLNGERNAGPDLCRSLAKALDEPEEKVFRLAGLLSPLPAGEDATLHELVEFAKQLSAQDRQELLQYARFRYQRRQEE